MYSTYRTRRVAVTLVMMSSLAAAPYAAPSVSPEASFCQAEGEPDRVCCFVNHGFSGTCVVTPAEKETCETILGYLNDIRSTGKTYCRNTEVRGGWRQVRCEPDGQDRRTVLTGDADERPAVGRIEH